MTQNDAFPAVFERLKSILKAYEPRLRVLDDQPGKYSVLGPYMEKYNKDLWLGMVQTGKAYVSFHFMPVYMFPDLLDDIPVALKKRMQGKSCFNFTKIDEVLFAELAELTRRGMERLKQEGIST
jgi:hypothetical protein